MINYKEKSSYSRLHINLKLLYAKINTISKIKKQTIKTVNLETFATNTTSGCMHLTYEYFIQINF